MSYVSVFSGIFKVTPDIPERLFESYFEEIDSYGVIDLEKRDDGMYEFWLENSVCDWGFLLDFQKVLKEAGYAVLVRSIRSGEESGDIEMVEIDVDGSMRGKKVKYDVDKFEVSVEEYSRKVGDEGYGIIM